MKRRLAWLAAAIVLVVLPLLYQARASISMALLPWLAGYRLAIDTAAGLPDGLHVGLCGTGSPFPDEDRAGPCTLVLAGQRLFVFDAGSGASRDQRSSPDTR